MSKPRKPAQVFHVYLSETGRRLACGQHSARLALRPGELASFNEPTWLCHKCAAALAARKAALTLSTGVEVLP